MANTYTNLHDLFTGIADAIRSKTGFGGTIVADKFPEEINKLQIGFDYVNPEVASIESYDFYHCKELLNINSYAIESIGDNAFNGCVNLRTVVLYDKVSTIGDNAFKGCLNATIYCEAESKPDGWSDNWNPDNLPVVWGYAPIETWDVSATSGDNVIAKVYNNVQEDGKYSLIINGSGKIKAFDWYFSLGGALTDAPWRKYVVNIIFCAISNKITNISKCMIYGNESMASMVIPYSVKSLDERAFAGCVNLTSIIIPESVSNIGDLAFASCANLTSIIIPNGITNIGKQTFWYNHKLSSIVIPSSVTSIGDSAFYRCYALKDIIYKGTMAQWNAITLGTDWNVSTGNYTIHCIDGDIAKS